MEIGFLSGFGLKALDYVYCNEQDNVVVKNVEKSILNVHHVTRTLLYTYLRTHTAIHTLHQHAEKETKTFQLQGLHGPAHLFEACSVAYATSGSCRSASR